MLRDINPVAKLVYGYKTHISTALKVQKILLSEEKYAYSEIDTFNQPGDIRYTLFGIELLSTEGFMNAVYVGLSKFEKDTKKLKEELNKFCKENKINPDHESPRLYVWISWEVSYKRWMGDLSWKSIEALA